jgi:ArsR family transcriptional regulator
MMLCDGELCVCQLIKMLGLAPSTVSKHMSILRQARLVQARKEGKWMYYRFPMMTLLDAFLGSPLGAEV